MKKLLLSFSLIFAINLSSSQNLTVDQTTYSVEELVTEVLINSPCANVSNITFSTGTNFGSNNGIGFFEEPSGLFPFGQGLMMAAGDAAQGAGPNPAVAVGTGGVGWPGDPELTAILTNPTDGTFNATVIEFDFVPIASEVSFRFLMASEEYDMGGFECEYSDVFAFFLTDEGGVTTNLAVLPDTNLPILVTNVHPDNGICGAANPQFFSQYVAPGGAPIAYDGYTRSFTAFSNVNPGETYHIKLAVADARDAVWDSAVFLEAGSFDLGLDLGEDILIASGNAVCDGNSVSLNTGSPAANHKWYLNGVEIDGATESILEVLTPGDYSVHVVFSASCQSSDSIIIEFIENPVANPAPNLFKCSGGTSAMFDLTQNDDDILGVQNPSDYAITYYESQPDADDGINALVSPFTNTVNPQTIFARIESNNNSDCYDITTFEVEASNIGFSVPVSEIILCDDDLDGVTQFMLTDRDDEVAASAGYSAIDLSITYHLSQSDADLGLNAQVSPYSNTSNPQTIYVHVEELANPSCYGSTSFELIVDPLPSLIDPTPLVVCDDAVADGLTSIDLNVKDDEIRGGNPNYAITYYLTQGDADAPMNQLSIPYTNISNPQIIYVRGQDINTGCYSTTTLELVVEQAPLANLPTPLEYCDPDSDGFGVFTLTDSDLEITGGLPGLTVSYHETLADAQNNVNVLVSPYNNIVVNTQTLYARVESATIATDCYTIVELVLIVHPDPQIGTVDGLEVCDDNTDGFAQFDLTQVSTQLLNGIDPALVTISYYETQGNAEAETNAILVPTSYTNITNPQTVWIRVEYDATGCYKVTSLSLLVNELPVLTQPSPLELCDVNDPGDEMESFTLEDSILEILNGQTGMSITFYETQGDADLGANALLSPYTNLTNPQTIYARAENDVTGCVSTITLDLRVNPIPSPVVPTAQEVCDDDNDGFSNFDLESSTVEIINGELDISISYHETHGDAEQGVNALMSPYDNIVPTLQTVYVRAENGLTGCFTIVELDLNVLPSPEIPLGMDDHVVCDDDDDGFMGSDLSEMDSVILGTQDPSLFILSYHLTQGDADVGANPIVNVTNYTNITNPQTLYVRLESITNGCVSTGSFDIRVELPPIPVQPTPLEECDDEIADEITVFDLTVKDAEITGGNGSWVVSYYQTDADAQGDVNVIDPATSYTNTAVGVNPANPQTLYVRVTDTDTGCYAFTTLTIRVLPNPTPSLDPSNIELCDDTNTGDTQEEFDLTLNQGYIINGEAGVSATYHESLEDAHSGVNAIVDPAQYTNTSATQTIWVRVTNDITGCYTLVSFDIIVNPLPDVIAVTDYIVCEVDTDGFWSFDLESKTDEVLNGQDALEYAVSYHLTQGDAELGINALVSPYTNITNPQQIFVNITNTLTGCDIATVSFNIEVQQGAEANSDGEAIVYVLCDDNMETDGDPSNDSVQFDLTVQDGAILDGQDPLNYTVSYYESLSDAELGFNPLPTLYENITNPQQIYARVDNDTTLDSICYAVTELTLLVEPLPVFDLEESFVLCVDTNGTEIIDPPVIETGLSEIDYSFVWQLNGVDISGATGSSLTPTQGGSYSVLVMDNVTGCQSTDTVVVSESSPPIVTAQVSSLAFAEDHVVEAVATGLGEYEYSLDDGPWQSSGTFTGVSAGDHVVTARDINGCGIATTTVLAIDYPLYFTPNGDGYHDTWNIVGIATQPNAKIYIFDRYGKLLKQLSPTGEGWNGTYNGAPLPSNDYWFTVVYDEPRSAVKKEFKAHFTLKR